MDTQQIVVERAKALQLYRDYKRHAHWQQPVDWEIQRTYQLLAQGRLIIRALESIKLAGLKPQGLPKLAIACATAQSVDCRMSRNGGCIMNSRADGHFPWLGAGAGDWVTRRNYIQFPIGSFPTRREEVWRATALVPGIPLTLRPRRGLASYHILFEAEWTRVAPHDPMLLRHIGKGDLWLVVAQWDLSAVERAALSTRL